MGLLGVSGSVYGQQPDFGHMSPEQIRHYSDSVTQSVMQHHSVQQSYGITQPKLDNTDTTQVSMQFVYEENTHTSFSGGASSSAHVTISAGSRTATMISGNNSIMVLSSDKSQPGRNIDHNLKGTIKYSSVSTGTSEHLEVHEKGAEPINLSFSFHFDKSSNMGGAEGGGSIATLDNGEGQGMVSPKFSLHTDPAGNVLPDNQQSGRNGNDKDICLVEKTSYGYKVTYFYTDRQGSGADLSVTTIKLTAMIGYTPKEYEALIMPINWDYEKWIPKGPKVTGADDAKGDRTRKFKIVVREKLDTTKLYPGSYTVTWGLSDVSKYLGFCNNYPKYDNPITDPDLKFDDTMKTEIEFEHNTTDDYAKTVKGCWCLHICDNKLHGLCCMGEVGGLCGAFRWHTDTFSKALL